MPLDSRIWIYPSNRKFSDEEVEEIKVSLEKFIEEWSAHGAALEASFDIRYNRFIILAVNQDVQAASGCSIDSSVQFIQQLENKYQVDLLDKMNVTFKNGEFIAHKSLIDFKKMAKEKILMRYSTYLLLHLDASKHYSKFICIYNISFYRVPINGSAMLELKITTKD